MTLNAVFRVDGIPCLIADFVATGTAVEGQEVPTYPDTDAALSAEPFKVVELTRKATWIAPGFVVAASGNGATARRIGHRLVAMFEGTTVTAGDLEAALGDVDEFTDAPESCVLVGWVGLDAPISFRWSSQNCRSLALGGEYVEGSGARLYRDVIPHASDMSIDKGKAFDGAAEVCILRTATLWVNELLRANTLRDRFGVGYDIFIFDGNEFRIVTDVTYLLFKLEFKQAENGSVTYRLWTPPTFTKQTYVDENCLIRVFLPPNMLGISHSPTERMGIVPPLIPRSTGSAVASTPFRDMPLTSRYYGVCFFGEAVSGMAEVFTAIASGEDAAQFKIYVSGQRKDGLDEIKFELPPSIMDNMLAAAVQAFERGSKRLQIGS